MERCNDNFSLKKIKTSIAFLHSTVRYFFLFIWFLCNWFLLNERQWRQLHGKCFFFDIREISLHILSFFHFYVMNGKKINVKTFSTEHNNIILLKIYQKSPNSSGIRTHISEFVQNGLGKKRHVNEILKVFQDTDDNRAEQSKAEWCRAEWSRVQ